MKFKQWLEDFSSVGYERKPHVNKLGSELAASQNLIKGPNAWNQADHNCYEIAASLAEKFGYEPISPDEIRSVVNKFQRYWASKNAPWMAKVQPPKVQSGIANFVIRMGDEFRNHVTFEYRSKEYNYGAIGHDGFKILCKIGLKPKSN
jgi:hypothetical protein